MPGTATAVAVTNADGPVGRALCEGLSTRGWQVTGVAADTPDWVDLSAYRWVQAEVNGPDVLRGIEGADVVLHVECADDLGAALGRRAVQRRADCRLAGEAVGTAVAAAGAEHLVLVTSAMVYGAVPDRTETLREDAPILSVPDDGLVGDMVTLEQVGDRIEASHPHLRVTRLRPAALAGGGVDTVVTRQFEAPRLLTLRGHDMAWQFCHVDDLVAAAVRVVEDQIGGPVTVGASGWLCSREVEDASGMGSLELPSSLAFGTAARLHRVGVLPMPVEDLSYVVHPWLVGSQTLRSRGWRPQADNDTCLAALLAGLRGSGLPGLRVSRKDAAALGVAGAAVAVIGTAAIWRQARSGRGRR